MSWQPPPVSLYIHIPWCVRKCPYCDFNSHQAGEQIPENKYVDALLRDLEQDLDLFGPQDFHSIFLGGGTPSLFSGAAIDRLLMGINSLNAIGHNSEITLEANPGALDSGHFNEFRGAGVNRISIGVQSFGDQQLIALGRVHSAQQASEAIQAAATAGFENINLDLMFGLPNQDLANAVSDVQTAIEWQPAQISYYQLTLEPNTLFYSQPPKLPDDDSVWAIQREGKLLLAEAGYLQYEVSAYARSGFQCQHNLNYWNFGDYLGIGAGAHGKFSDVQRRLIQRSWKIKQPAKYLETAGHSENIGGRSIIGTEQIPFEFVMNALRLNAGFDLIDYSKRTGLPDSTLEPKLTRCIDEGLLEKWGSRIKCTARGSEFLNSLLQQFLDD